MKKSPLVILLSILFITTTLSQTDFKGVYRCDKIAYQLTIRDSTFENGTCGYPGYGRSEFFQRCHSERGTYYVIDSAVDTLRGTMLTMDDMLAVQPNYSWIVQKEDTLLYAYFYNKTNGPYVYFKTGDIPPDTTVSPQPIYSPTILRPEDQ